ncbi:aldo/keto reductase [Leptothrix sp. BB-4]
MPTRRIGPFEVSAIGLGCMNLSHAYGQPPAREHAAALLHRALDLGVTLLDTAALYGFGANESLVGELLAGERDRYVLASKCGMTGVDGARVIDGRPETIRATCEASLQRLRTDVIDLYQLHRWDQRVPIEDSVGAMADLVRAGKVRSIGLSEVSAATLRRAHAVHPIAAVQSEYSLWTRNPEIAVLEACREIGAAFIAFSPVGRGFLTDVTLDASTFDAKDIRRAMPRFMPEHLAANTALLDALRPIAAEAGCTLAQLALAWLLARADHIVPIPGTASIPHLEDNLGALRVSLTQAQMTHLDQLMPPGAARGGRYSVQNQGEVDTEEF